MRVHAAADRFRVVALEQMRRADRELDDFDAALNRAHRVEKDLAVLLADDPRHVLLALFHQLAEARQDASAWQRRRRAPGRKRRGSRLHCGIDFLGLRERHEAHDLAGGRIGDLAETTRLMRSRMRLPVDPEGNARDH